ncbi:sugar transferase [Qipengyuania sp. CAU 1752]
MEGSDPDRHLGITGLDQENAPADRVDDGESPLFFVSASAIDDPLVQPLSPSVPSPKVPSCDVIPMDRHRTGLRKIAVREEWPSSQRMSKRACDILVSLALIVLLFPLMLAIGCLLVAQGGPALFRQRRIGKNGELFNCYKFRTMRSDADAVLRKLLAENPRIRLEWHRRQKLANDPRITRLGRLMRKTSLDELPQLVNVLRGDMSLVGPRPIIPTEATRYRGYLGHYLAVRPGLTGLWQVSGRNDTTYPRRVALDVAYVRNASLRLDLAILLRTVPALLKTHGAR